MLDVGLVGQAHEFLKGDDGNEPLGEVIKADPLVDLLLHLLLRPLYLLRLPLSEIALEEPQILMGGLLDLQVNGPFLELALHEFEHQPHLRQHLLLHFLEVGSHDILELLKLAAVRLQANDLLQAHIMLDFQLAGLDGICPRHLYPFLEPALHHLPLFLDLCQPLPADAL